METTLLFLTLCITGALAKATNTTLPQENVEVLIEYEEIIDEEPNFGLRSSMEASEEIQQIWKWYKPMALTRETIYHPLPKVSIQVVYDSIVSSHLFQAPKALEMPKLTRIFGNTPLTRTRTMAKEVEHVYPEVPLPDPEQAAEKRKAFYHRYIDFWL